MNMTRLKVLERRGLLGNNNRRLVAVIAVIVTTLIFYASILNSTRVLAVQEIPDFSVAAVGDWGLSCNTSKTIANMVKSNPAFSYWISR